MEIVVSRNQPKPTTARILRQIPDGTYKPGSNAYALLYTLQKRDLAVRPDYLVCDKTVTLVIQCSNKSGLGVYPVNPATTHHHG
jgi:hypothetical protein